MTAQPTRSYAKLALAIVLAAAIVAASILASSYLGPTKTTTTTLTENVTLTEPCDTEAVPGSSPGPTDEHTPVLLMNPNTTAYVCVTYQSAWQGNQALFNSDLPSYGPYLTNGTYTFYPFTIVNYQGCGPAGGASCTQIT
jgi:hypothetical protein